VLVGLVYNLSGLALAPLTIFKPAEMIADLSDWSSK
jgi:hypothetical protein